MTRASDVAKLITNGGTIVDGNISFASGHGIDYSATSDASGQSSELFDDYEEGAWTPVVADSSSGGNTASGIFVGQYIKVGKFVQIYCSLSNINTSGMTSGNSIHVQGLPFTVSFSDSGNSASLYGIGTVETDRFTFENYITTRVNHDYTFVIFRDNDVNAQDSSVKISDVYSSGNSDMYFTLSYPSA